MAVDFEFYVMNYNFNRKQVENYNIFDNFYVDRRAHELAEMYMDHELTFSEMRDELDKVLRREFWSRREYEIFVGDAFEYDITKFDKWDCYSQVLPNLDTVVSMIIRKSFEDMYGVSHEGECS